MIVRYRPTKSQMVAALLAGCYAGILYGAVSSLLALLAANGYASELSFTPLGIWIYSSTLWGFYITGNVLFNARYFADVERRESVVVAGVIIMRAQIGWIAYHIVTLTGFATGMMALVWTNSVTYFLPWASIAETKDECAA